TNNSFASEAQVVAKLTRLGIHTDGSHVLGAGQAAVQNIARRFPGATVYVVGEQPLSEMVLAHGLRAVDSTSPGPHSADAVLVGQSGEAVMIGDNLGVDILAGQAAGTQTLLVLSGKDTRASLEASSIKPDFVYENLAAVLADLQKPL